MRRVVRLLARGSRPVETTASAPLAALDAKLVDMRQGPARANESLEDAKRRLLYQSTYRGMAEMDYIMGTFAAMHLPAMTRPETDEWDLIVRQYDSEIYRWLIQDKVGEVPVAIREGVVWGRLKDHGKDAIKYR